MSKEFKDNNEWYDGYAEDGNDKNKGWLDETREGDVLVMKSSSTKGPGRKITFTKIKGIGILQSKYDYYHFQVRWLNVPDLPIDVDGIWYANTIEPLREDEVFEFVKSFVEKFEIMNLISLLQYKMQIILQGPPGTGKTKLAKELARALIVPKRITVEDIKRIIKLGLVVKSKADDVPYTVDSINNVGIGLKLQNGNTQIRNYQHIIQAYENLLANKPLTGGDAYQAAIAKYIRDNWEDESTCKLVQFHPSYSYEDFVRGIVAESKGQIIEYKNINKLLAQFAEAAKRNWDDSRKETAELSKAKKVREYFEQFVDELSEKITGDEVIKLTKSVNVVDVEEDAFRYKGADGWSALGARMLFKDIIQAYLDGNKVRQDIKKNKNLSGLAVQHASYFVRVLNMFQDYLTKNNLTFDNLSQEKPELKNYVLIIDEINRANLSSVLGELIYALEYRGENVESMYEVDSSNKLVLPDNLYIIGTMNTADRSVGHIDYAIRRRFAFVDVLPKILDDNFETNLFKKVSELFVKDIAAKELAPADHLSSEFQAKDVWLGHSYFIKKEGVDSRIRLQYEIIPILEEYIKDGVLRDSKDLRSIINALEKEIV